MATRTESLHVATLATDGPEAMGTRVIPIPSITTTAASSTSTTTLLNSTANMATPTAGEPMEISSPTNASSTSHSLDNEPNGKSNDRSKHPSPPEHPPTSAPNSTTMPAPPPSAAAAVHQPKIVQTAFIHKLYNMLEDPNIQHLISWTASSESFVMSPSPDFSKVLSQYFKHTNISSFVRQLNMYGFHKERDVFHTGNPDSTLWEFKHGNGNFKRGDLVGLREIRRRASRHALVHRESNYSKAATTSQPGTPAEPPQIVPDGSDARIANLEHTIYDLGARLQRAEESAHYVHIKNQVMMESMARLLSYNQELSRAMLSIVAPDSSIHRDVLNLQGEMQRQADIMRSYEEPPDSAYGARQQYLGNMDTTPVSPRQLPQDDIRRGNLAVPQSRGQPNYLHRPPISSNLSVATRRPYGSIGGGSTGPQASPLRNAAPAPPPGPHPLSNVVEPPPGSLGRRHTSADIRAHGWQPSQAHPGVPGTPPAWPPSPSRVIPEDQRIRESLSSFSLQGSTHPHPSSRPATPPPPPFSNGGGHNSDTFGSWSWNSAVSRDNKSLTVKDSSAPPTRRGSMAHILNPSSTAERDGEDEDPRGDDDRKRKRIQ
ncbi:HSF-type DNA-binding-domain-containing protein [Stachybotrys elegans]|uniref:HSF-type DNA-binding-domain-containing protein n=1 Tax=Stachybotrys elegans TaxID=80388 RepID=A0A8K0SWR0_9HYPO|nr:HSF-type DNA-binding-domain-containing protein [Stachybotrys elegans]